MPLYTNLDGTTPDKGPRDILKWQWDRLRSGAHKTDPFETPRTPNDGRALADLSAHLTWIGHATFAMRLGGKLVVTDPIWSTRIQGAIKRHVEPGVRFEDMPPIEIVTLSHSHFDHLDIPTLKRIGPNAIYIVPRDVGELLYDAGLTRVVELDWWQSHTLGDLTVTLVPAQHWSMRLPWDRNRRLWGGFVYSAHGKTAYHAGDTAYSPDVFSQIAKRFPAIDWAMLPIGAYEPAWFMKAQHMGPEEALKAFTDLGAKNFVAMHWGTFKLTDEPMGEPPKKLQSLFATNGGGKLWIPTIGETKKLTLPL
jgi:N-acyl-phosphatidylethanolamine-hydrolysing phospholipase D